MNKLSSDWDRFVCLLIVRHGPTSSPEQVKEVAAAIVRLRDELNSEWPLEVARIEHAGTPEAEATAVHLASTLCVPVGAAPSERRLGPPSLSAYSPATRCALNLARASIDRACDALTPGENALLIVGHQPALDWALDRPWLREPTTLGRCEMACFVRMRESRTRWHLWWVLTPSEDAQKAHTEMRQKVESKMTVLAVLAGFLAAILATLLTNVPDPQPRQVLILVASGIYGLAAIVFIGALLAYDRLLLPTHFWRTEAVRERGHPKDAFPVWRPPSSAAWVLYQTSVRLWKWVEWMLLAAGGATGLLAVSATWSFVTTTRLVVLGAGLGLVVFTVFWWKRHRPRFGFKD